jgi:hypothetical protein
MSILRVVPLWLLPAAFPAGAAITLVKDSADFSYIYTMDSAPNNQDLDANGTDDWWDAGVPSVSGGYAVNTADAQIFRGDFTGSVWRTVIPNNTGAVGWTLEITVAKTGGTQAANGWFGIATDAENLSSAVYLKDDRISIEQGATDLDFLTGASFGDGTYHTIRVAHDSVANSYYYWVNGALLNADLATPIAPGNPSINATLPSIFIGDYSSSIAGNYSIDAIRLTAGAFAPVPESGAALLGALGLLGLLRRRR